VLLISLFCDVVLCLACVLCGSYCASLVLCAEFAVGLLLDLLWLCPLLLVLVFFMGLLGTGIAKPGPWYIGTSRYR
jgi:hypothetical protein